MPTPNVVPTVGLIGAGATPQRQIYNGNPVNLSLANEVNKAGNLAPAMQALGKGMIDLKYRWDGVALKEEFVKRKLELDNAKAEFDNNSATGSYEDMVKAHEKMNAALKGFETFSSKYSNHQATPLMQQLNEYSLEVDNGLQASAAKKIKDYEIKTLGAETEMAVQDLGAYVRKNGAKSFTLDEYKKYNTAVREPLRRQIELSGIDPDSELGQHMERAGMSKLLLNEGLNLIAHGDLHLSMAWLNRVVETHAITTTDETAWLRAINAEKRRREAEARARQLQLTTLSIPAQAQALHEKFWEQAQKENALALKAEADARAVQKQNADAFKMAKTYDWHMMSGEEQDMWDRGDYFNAIASMESRLAEMEAAIPTMADVKMPESQMPASTSSALIGPQQASLQQMAGYEEALAEHKKEIEKKTKDYQDFQQFVQQAKTSVGKEIQTTPLLTPDEHLKQMYAIVDNQNRMMKNAEDPMYNIKQGLGLSLNTYRAQLYLKYGPEHIALAERELNQILSNPDKEEVALMIGGEGNKNSFQYIMANGTDKQKKAVIDMYSSVGANGLDLAVSKAIVEHLPDDELNMLATGNKAYLSEFSTSYGIAHSDLEALVDKAQLVQEERKQTANSDLFDNTLDIYHKEIRNRVSDPILAQRAIYIFDASGYASLVKAYSFSSTDINVTSKKVSSAVMYNKGMQAVEEAIKQAEAEE